MKYNFGLMVDPSHNTLKVKLINYSFDFNSIGEKNDKTAEAAEARCHWRRSVEISYGNEKIAYQGMIYVVKTTKQKQLI